MERIPYKIADKSFVIKQLGVLYKNPTTALKEYISNSIDSRLEEEKEKIRITTKKSEGVIVIEDNGGGMDFNFLRSLPEMIGKSSKRGLEHMIGSKAFGILSYQTFADECEIYSKTQKSKDFAYLKMLKGDTEAAFVNLVKPKDVELGGFERGTRVILKGIPEQTVSYWFPPSKIKVSIGDTYDPLLRRGAIDIVLHHLVDGRKPLFDDITPFKYNGKKIVETEIETDFGKIDLYLFLNPLGTSDKVKLYSKGVKVLNSIGELDEFDEDPWNRGRLCGWINANLELTPSRDGVVRDKRYEMFLQEIERYKIKLIEKIENVKETVKMCEADNLATDILNAIGVVTQYSGFDLKGKCEPREHHTISESGEQTERAPHDLNKPHKPRELRESRKDFEYKISFEVFDQSKRMLRSELNLVSKLIKINTKHPDFKKEFEESGDEKQAGRYMSLLFCKEIAQAEFRKALKSRKNIKIEELSDPLLERMIEIYVLSSRFLKI